MKTRGIQLVDCSNLFEGTDLKIEVKRDADGKIVQGMVVGDTMNQNRSLMLANPGEFKNNPTLGAAYQDLFFDYDFLGMRHRINEHFDKDGLRVRNIQLEYGKPLIIDASYE